MRRAPRNVRFSDLCRLAGRFGFERRAGKGGHCVYTRPGVLEILNFQNVRGMTKPYRVRQFFGIVDKYDLEMED